MGAWELLSPASRGGRVFKLSSSKPTRIYTIQNNLPLHNLHVMAAPPPPIPLPLQIHQPALIPRPPAPANPPTPADHVHAVNYVKQVEAASGDTLFMHLRKEYTHNIIAAVGSATDIQLQHAYQYLSHI